MIDGAGSLVNKDVPDNSVVAGVPAQGLCTLDDYISKRETAGNIQKGMKVGLSSISPQLAKWCWDRFYESREQHTE